MLMIGHDAKLHCLFTMELLPWLAQLTVEPILGTIDILCQLRSVGLEWKWKVEVPARRAAGATLTGDGQATTSFFANGSQQQSSRRSSRTM